MTDGRWLLPIVSTRILVDDAFHGKYGVAAISVVNDPTMAAVPSAADNFRLSSSEGKVW